MEERQDIQEIIHTGIKELDDVITGFPAGNIVLVEGSPGTGKSILVARMVYENMVKCSIPILWISMAESKEEFMDNMANLRMDFRDLEGKGLFNFIETASIPKEEVLYGLTTTLSDYLRDTGSRIAVIDPIDPFIAGESLSDVFSWRTLLKNVLASNKAIVILVYGGILEDTYTRVLEGLADSVIRLDMEVPGMGAPRRFLEIVKMRGRPVGRVVFEVDIGVDKGIQLFPHGVIEELLSRVSMEDRLPTYIEGLDKLLNGGFIKGTSVLITGHPGSGKTMLLVTLACNWASRGYDVYFVSFEEPCQQLVETIKFLGYRPEELVDKKLFIRSINPRTITINSFFGVIMRNIICSENSIVIIDGLHSLWKEFGDIFHRYIRDLVYYCKSKGSTIVFSMAFHGEDKVPSITWVSTIADCIVELLVTRKDSMIKRYIGVRKHRMSEVEPRYYELELIRRKLTVII